MKGRLISGMAIGNRVWNHQLRRGMVGKASNRAAVHGSKLHIPDTVDKEYVEMEIERAKQDKEKKRKEIENVVDSQLKNWQLLSIEKILSCLKSPKNLATLHYLLRNLAQLAPKVIRNALLKINQNP